MSEPQNENQPVPPVVPSMPPAGAVVYKAFVRPFMSVDEALRIRDYCMGDEDSDPDVYAAEVMERAINGGPYYDFKGRRLAPEIFDPLIAHIRDEDWEDDADDPITEGIPLDATPLTAKEVDLLVFVRDQFAGYILCHEDTPMPDYLNAIEQKSGAVTGGPRPDRGEGWWGFQLAPAGRLIAMNVEAERARGGGEASE